MGTLYKKAECRLVSWKPLEAILCEQTMIGKNGICDSPSQVDQKKSSCRLVDSQSQKNHPREEPCVTRSTTRDKRLGVPLDVFIAKTLTTSRASATSSLTQLKEERFLSKSAYVLIAPNLITERPNAKAEERV